MIDSISHLIPVHGFFNFSFNNCDDISALFIEIMFVAFIGSIFWVCRSSAKFFSDIKSIFAMLEGKEESRLAFERTDLKEKAKKISDNVGHLWQEFDETLIEVDEDEQVKLHNTLDAEAFFNPSTLTGGLTDNRLLVAVPSFLTAVGVLGTFVGLQLGLAQLNLDSSVSVEEMKVGISGVINGAKMAFTTSVFGVLLSLIFNIYEKLESGKARMEVEKLQKKIDHLFPRLSSESQLYRIADDGRQSRESLQGLAEKIGEKMQESLIEATAGIQAGLEQSLEKIMAPAINKLVDETSDGNQKALENLVENFMDKFGEQGLQQREAMDKSTANVGAALEDMTSAMDGFIRNLRASQDASGEREQQLVELISLQVSELVDQGQNQKKMMMELVENQLRDISSSLNEREMASQKREQEMVEKISGQVQFLVQTAEKQNRDMSQLFERRISSLTEQFGNQEVESAIREETRNKTFVEQTAAMKAGTEKLLSRVEEGFKTQLTASIALVEQGKGLQQSVEASVRASSEAANRMKETASELNGTSQNIRVAGSEIRAAGQKMTGAISEAAETCEKVSEQNQEGLKQIGTLCSQLSMNSESLQRSIDKMYGVVELANTAFDNMTEQQNRFLDQQKINVETLSTKMTSLLRDYAEQANSCTKEHLDVWSQETYEYASRMNEAMKALASIVDEIEVRVG